MRHGGNSPNSGWRSPSIIEPDGGCAHVYSMSNDPKPADAETTVTETPPKPAPEPEFGGPKGLEPTRYGDWTVKGRCIDF